MPLFSIVTPLYNKEADIANTLRSVLSQTIEDFELIIINDGSTDNGIEVAMQFEDERINIVTTENKGASHARNTGVNLAKSEHIVFLDADDYWYPDHLENIKSLIEALPNENWYSTAYEIEHNNRFSLPIKSPAMVQDEQYQVLNFFENSLIDSIAWTSAICTKKAFFNTLGGFDQSLKNGEDIDLWIRAGINSPLAFSKKISAKYLLTTSNRISTRKITNTTVVDFNKYEKNTVNNPHLKTYLDLNRYAVAIRYKCCGDKDNFRIQKQNLFAKNLTRKQNLLLALPSLVLRVLFAIQHTMTNKGIRLRTS